MPQNAHPELVSAEAEGLRQSPKETAPYISTLRLRAAETSPQPGLDAGSAGITTPFGIVAECCLMHSNPVPPPAGGGCHTASRNHPTQFSEAEIPALPAMAAAAAIIAAIPTPVKAKNVAWLMFSAFWAAVAILVITVFMPRAEPEATVAPADSVSVEVSIATAAACPVVISVIKLIILPALETI